MRILSFGLHRPGRYVVFALALLVASPWVYAADTVAVSARAPDAMEESAVVSGVVRYSARVPRMYGAEPESGDTADPDDDPAAQGLQYALVHLELEGQQQEDGARSARNGGATSPPARINQVGFRFVPKVLAVQAGQSVIIGNQDYENHSVRVIGSNSRNLFNIVTVAGDEYTERFLPEEHGAPLRLVCDFHPSMEAWVYVFEHSRFAVTDSEGRFSIGPVKPGMYHIVIQHPLLRVQAEASVELQAGRHYKARTTFHRKDQYYRDSPPVGIEVVAP